MEPYAHPSFRHQVFELPQQPLQVTEYQLFHGRCRGCGEVTRGSLPADAPRGQMGPALQAHVGVLAGQYHLSVRKIGRLRKRKIKHVKPLAWPPLSQTIIFKKPP